MIIYIEYLFYQDQFDHVLIQVKKTYLWTLKYLYICVTIHTICMGGGESLTYWYFILLFFTLSVEVGRCKVNDAIFTLSAVFFILIASLTKNTNSRVLCNWQEPLKILPDKCWWVFLLWAGLTKLWIVFLYLKSSNIFSTLNVQC